MPDWPDAAVAMASSNTLAKSEEINLLGVLILDSLVLSLRVFYPRQLNVAECVDIVGFALTILAPASPIRCRHHVWSASI